MITVIIAGGSGTRLWPLSTPEFPKHLLKINSDSQSLLQNTYERAKSISSATYIVTEDSHAHHVKGQLPDLSEEHFVIEPGRRGTANCIIAALVHLSSRHDGNEPIAFLHADHYVRDVAGFEHSLKIAAAATEKEERIVLVGVEPDYPATGFGYIQKDNIFDEETFIFNVHSFKEKPDYKTAKEYVKSGNYLWNCGYFVGSVNLFKQNMKEHSPEMHQNYTELKKAKSAEEFRKSYIGFDNIAIDYALIEKVNDLLVVPASFDWMDLGSFIDLHKAVESDEQGNHVHGSNIELEGVENSFVQNHEDKPVAVIGLDNVAVINTPHGLLVTRKDLAQKVGEVSKKFKSK
jgi:mannose-1-phosphate guanylyltransferase